MKSFYFALFVTILFYSCHGKAGSSSLNDTIYVHDTVMPSSNFTYNLPCKVNYLNFDKSGKATLCIWLHGGINDQKWHSLLTYENHFTYHHAHDSIFNYLNESGTKAVYLIPICHKANINHCVAWIDCADDLKKMIDDYVNQGIVDKQKIFIFGASDGGAGVWDIIEKYDDLFAYAVAQSCSSARKVSTPVCWMSTSKEGNYTAKANELKAQGCNLTYIYHEGKHGSDQEELTHLFLQKIFSKKK